MESFLIAVGPCPFRYKCFIPIQSIYTKDELAKKQDIRLPPALPGGCFEKIRWTKNCRLVIYAFVYDTAVACRESSSDNHKLMLKDVLEEEELDDATLHRSNFLQEQNSAGAYLYPNSQFKYVVNHDHTAIYTEIPDVANVGQQIRYTEGERCQCLVKSLRQVPYIRENKINVDTTSSLFKPVKKKVCPFTGGGDIFIGKTSRNVLAANTVVVCLGELKEELDQVQTDPSASPLEDGEIRGPSVIEGKQYTNQDQPEIDLQLKANMMLTATHKFYDSVMHTPTSGDELQALSRVQSLTGYGITFGCSSSLVVYKMVMDFENNTCQFVKRFQCDAHPSIGYYVNCALAYVINRVSNWK